MIAKDISANLIPRWEYEQRNAADRGERMQWWKQARFGIFVHLGLYSVLGRHESALMTECIPQQEYDQLIDGFRPVPGCAAEWARLAKRAGAKYMVFTTKHSEGYCLWDTAQTDYNSVKTGPRRDLVREYVEACRAEGLKVGLYYPFEDCHHPDYARIAYDPESRRRFIDFNSNSLRELMTNYGRIDILWYDSADILKNALAWEADAQNQMVRALQPHILINDRSQIKRLRDPKMSDNLIEDFTTPEGHLTAAPTVRGRGWEAAMTFNSVSWGYMHGAEVDSWRARDIVKMLGRVGADGGNLILNIGPLPDGSVPTDALEPLEATGRWLELHQEAIYGDLVKSGAFPSYCGVVTQKGKDIYFWRFIWAGTEQGLGGYKTKLNAVTCLTTGESVRFRQDGYRIQLLDLPWQCPDALAGIAVYKLEFEEVPEFHWLPTSPGIVAARDI
jgi:alpha-L-fucosidase